MAALAAPGDKQRILHVVLDLEAGGLERLVADLLRRLDRGRFELHLLALRHLGRHAEGLESVCRIHTGPSMSRFSLLWPRALTRALRRIQPDVVHTHSGVWYKVAVAARAAGVPWIVHTDHGRQDPDPLRDRVLDGLASRKSDAVVAVSGPLADRLRSSVVRFPERVLTILNGIDTGLFAPGPKSPDRLAALGVPAGRLVVGSLGRFDRIKGYDVVLRAFSGLALSWRNGEPPWLVLAGEGPEEAELRGLAARLHIGHLVSFPGWQSDVPDVLRALDIFVLGSRSEGTSIGLLEAMSCGICPVVTRVGGNADVLGPELEHRLAPSEDPVALAARLRDALVDASRRNRDGMTARARVTTNFSVDRMVEQYAALYDRFRTHRPA